MLKSLKIENFRRFDSFELKQLGRVNLLVGENNSGKTSVLEALILLLSRWDLEPLGRIMIARGEFFINSKAQTELDLCHLFRDHDLGRLSIRGQHDSFQEQLTLAVRETFTPQGFSELLGDLELDIEWVLQHQEQDSPELQHRSLNLSPSGGWPMPSAQRSRKEKKLQSPQVYFIPVAPIVIEELFKLFEDIQLTPQENLVYQALRTIEPQCERIAGKPTHNRFEVKLAGQEQPIPLGSMGDGMSRILRLALGMANAQGGVLLVDEIDTGLHFTAMVDMWKMIWKTAQKLNVQVFATTHSRDCWESLAEMAESEMAGENEIMIHRIEKAKSSSVTFDSQQMAIAVEEGIEVR
ncbi:AAA family ATPase [Alkalinema pantanalense CENA528]|uniref:AAA family ATPase n=1 Tax=Alkalinema pantanalense TaxID=1620705 RepID=UPI003D6F8EDC